MPFKQYMIISYIKKPYNGFFMENMNFPYEFTVKVLSWWGYKERTKVYQVDVSERLDVSAWMLKYKGRWIKKLPWRSH